MSFTAINICTTVCIITVGYWSSSQLIRSEAAPNHSQLIIMATYASPKHSTVEGAQVQQAALSTSTGRRWSSTRLPSVYSTPT